MAVLLVTNSTKKEAEAALNRACAMLKASAIEYECISSEHLELGDPFMLLWERRIVDFELVCVFGGDGTILRAAHLIAGSGIPLLGFNFGNMGFLTGAAEEHLLPAIKAALAKTLHVDERTFATVSALFKNGSQSHQLALNEVVATRGDSGRIVSLDLEVNGSFMENSRGDGVLISTATGSTAYALSAGGPLISPRHSGLVVVPISPHSLKSWSIVTGPDDEICLYPAKDNAQRVVLFVDGEALLPEALLAQNQAEATRGDALGDEGFELQAVTVRPSEARLQLLRYSDYDFYAQIARSFFRGGYAE